MEQHKDVPNLVTEWMDNLRSAWLSLDVDKAVELFSDCTEYGEDPFQEPLVRNDQIRQVWQEIRGQLDLKVDLQLLAWTGEIATIRWYARFRTDGSPIRQFDGVYVVHFNSAGRCSRFQQWWTEGPAVPAQ